MKTNVFEQTYSKIIKECKDKGLVDESWLGDKLRGAGNFLRKVNHFGSANESEKITGEFKQRFATLMTGIGFQPGAKDKTCFAGQAEDGTEIGFKVIKNHSGVTKVVLYDTSAGSEKGQRKKLGSKEVSESAGEDTFRKAMNGLLDQNGIAKLQFKSAEDQEKEAKEKEAADKQATDDADED